MTSPAPEKVSSRLDPTRSNYVYVVGRKESGKSVLARHLWLTYPYDRYVVDPNNDVLGVRGKPSPVAQAKGTRRLSDPIPDELPGAFSRDLSGQPSGRPRERASLVYVPTDPGDLENLDRFVGKVYQHGNCLLWIDEIGLVAPVNRTPRNMRIVLHQGRHRNLSLLMCGPRPVDVDKLCLRQADYVYVFDVPGVDDLELIAKTIGYSVDEFVAAAKALPEYGYLRFDARARRDDPNRLLEFPPLPENLAR